MSFIQSIFFGIIQGITEFLPISSTGHITLFGKLFNTIDISHPEQWTAYIAVIQIGTLLAVITYFFKDILSILQGFFQDNFIKPKKWKDQSQESKLGWYVLIGTAPIIIIGLLFKKVIEGYVTKSLFVIAISLIIFGILLGIAEKVAKHSRNMEKITWKDALFVGIGQVFSLIPGSSRSGTTITAGLFLGLNRETAARFSFLLSLPAVFASGVLELFESIKFLDHQLSASYGIGILFAFISGYVSIHFFLAFLKIKSTWVFVWYRILLGIGILVYYMVLV